MGIWQALLTTGRKARMTVQTADWDQVGQIWALFPMMLIVMVLTMSYKLLDKVLEPETLQAVSPVAETALLTKGSGIKALLPPGGSR